MTYKRERALQRAFATVLTAVLLLGIPCFSVEAAEAGAGESAPVWLEFMADEGLEEDGPVCYTLLTGCDVLFASHSDGLYIHISTGASRKASVVGIKDIVVEEKQLIGWKEVAVSDGGEDYNVYSFGGSFTYEGAVYNKKYRVTCTHYATVDSPAELYHETDPYTYNYKK
ncbi:MAG: hypothetical protein NC094_06135 [Bacteroidales bacterium]|nr:hypothetical protein [Lachnoclostridium sp.]MCM1383318.1 hypothetical protein [Lachnoclostridium sp.]MCM1464982.1 hypothetical protein [Bacteroidales bacterium]